MLVLFVNYVYFITIYAFLMEYMYHKSPEIYVIFICN